MQINMSENPLFWLHKRRGRDGKTLISEMQMMAGCQLQDDFFRSTRRARMTIDLSQPRALNHSRNHDGIPLTDSALAARNRVNAALNMLGPGLADITVEVCCYMHGLEFAERHLGWPKRAGKIVLGISLNRLALFYGLRR